MNRSLLNIIVLFAWLPLMVLAAKGDRKGEASASAAPGAGVPAPRKVAFGSGTERLSGYLWTPEGKGPFRVMIWHAGNSIKASERNSVSIYNSLVRAFLSDNYMLFILDGNSGVETSDYSAELQGLLRSQPDNPVVKQRKNIEGLEVNSRDLRAAMLWIREQPGVDREKICISGLMNGATQGLIAAEHGRDFKAIVMFSPGIVSWNVNPLLQQRIRKGVENAEVPIFLVQPQNDLTLSPTELLAPILKAKGGLNQSKVYPPYGSGAEQGKQFAINAWNVWGYDVLTFLDQVLAKSE